MKKNHVIFVMFVFVVSFISACAPEKTAGDNQRDQQERINAEGVAKVGMPAIKNFREAKLLRSIQELCDTEIVTYTYLDNMIPTVVKGHTALGGKLTYLGSTISYPIPYAAQLTAPETMQRYYVSRSGKADPVYGVARLPQPDPNGIHKPTSTNATWVMMKDPNSDKVAPAYAEPNLLSFPFKLPMD